MVFWRLHTGRNNRLAAARRLLVLQHPNESVVNTVRSRTAQGVTKIVKTNLLPRRMPVVAPQNPKQESGGGNSQALNRVRSDLSWLSSTGSGSFPARSFFCRRSINL